MVDDGEDEDDRHAGKQDVERDLVRRLLAHRALDERYHAVEEGRAGCRRDAHHDPVRQHARAAGDRRAVAAALADDGRRFSGDRRFVDRGDALDHVAVARHHVAGFDEDEVVLLQLQGGDLLVGASAGALEPLRLGLGARAAQGVGLGLAAALGQGFGKIGEEHGEPQPADDLRDEADEDAARREAANEQHRGQGRHHLGHEDDRVLRERARIELAERVHDRARDDAAMETRGSAGAMPLAPGCRHFRHDVHDLPLTLRTACRSASACARRPGQARVPRNR